MGTLSTARKQRGRPFQPGQSGNPAGRPKGARNKATLAAEALLDGEAQTLTRKAVEMALDGNPVALKLCLERILPVRRDRLTSFELPDAPKNAGHAIRQAMAAGELTLTEAGKAMDLIKTEQKVIAPTPEAGAQTIRIVFGAADSCMTDAGKCP